MPNAYVPPDHISPPHIDFPPSEAHHLHRVRRQKVGDQITVVDGRGARYLVRLDQLYRDQASGTILSTEQNWGEPTIQLTLAQALPKGRKIDLTIEKGTEIGVSGFMPFLSDRTIPQPGRDHNRSERWQAIAISAMKQSDRSVCPRIHPVQDLAQLIDTFSEYDTVYVACAAPVISTIQKPQPGHRILLMIGPEGGFSSAEIDQMKHTSALFLSLGNRILRTETAGLVCASMLLYHNLIGG